MAAMEGVKGIMASRVLSRLNAGASDQRFVGPEEIMRIVIEMQGYDGGDTERAEVFSDRYPDFLEQCPVLFEKACGPNIDMNMLRMLVDRAVDGDSESASSAMSDTFVAPVLARGSKGGDRKKTVGTIQS